MGKKVSIVIPYNRDRGWLNEAEQSIESQTYENIEVIHSQSNNGVSYNLNRGIERTTGDFIKYLCEDDMLTSNSIEDSVKAMQGVDFIHGNALTLHDNLDVRKYYASTKRPTLSQMAHSNCIHGGSLMYRADVFERFGLFDESLWTGEEYDFNMLIMSKGAKLGFCDSFLYIYRRHDEQKSLGRKANQHERKKAIRTIRQRYV
jgi:glycosyltransferase involved in cell wall biosynthesis